MSGGITTSEGNWYHITRDGINEYIPGLLQKYTLERIIHEADAWMKSADSLSLFLFLILAFTGLGPFIAAGAALIFYLLWYFNVSAFVSPSLGRIMRVIQNDGVIYVTAGAAFIYFAFTDTLPIMWTGIVLFFLFKVGLLRLGLKWLISKKEQKGPEKADRVLNMLLIRYGMKEGKLTGDVDHMRDELVRIANYHKTKDK